MDTTENVSLPKLPETTVYIFNLSEDVWPFISAMSDPQAKKREIEENADLGDRDLFSFCGEDHMIFVLPKPIDDAFFTYFESIFGKKIFQILVPKNHSGEICRDIQKDTAIMDALVKAANGQKRLVIKSYSTSQQFLDLVGALRTKGLTVFTPDGPEEDDAWTVNFYGSKSGIRQLAQQGRVEEPDLMMPEGVICMGVVDASKIAAKKFIKEHGVVIKTNKGHSGAGVLIFRENDLPGDYSLCEQAIRKELAKDSYWNIFPIIIESLIPVNSVIGGGFPNVEYRIAKNGHVEFLYYCGMRMDKNGVFKGVEINNDVLSDAVAARMVDTGFYIGEQYRAAGYRGYYDVDFVAAKNGHVYVTESNARRTGGTHVYTTALELFGKDFMYLTYILSNNAYALPRDTTYTFSEMVKKLTPILFSKDTKEGILLISENLLSYHQLGYIIFGTNKKRAYEIEAQMEGLI